MEISRYTLNNLSEYLFSVYHDNWRSVIRSKVMGGLSLKAKLELTKKMIKMIEKDYTKDKCKGYHPGCPNCEGQLLLGYLDNYQHLLEWELEQK